ncbi:MAG: L-histidine N(alpha)-methyltransferase [Balneolaceae bacterium]|nr:L-histidine N(alpha)-methyltransferase [Balneolaceae bacterium]MBO6545210.1 L-histidine N(alpha)-methyltransferase [Balneolaceae bacterium]MBO6646606.1 L-histidine N(alpha)-methyltransferase [Balneolaceae bacterium]
MLQEVLHGMSLKQKSLPSKYFYDQRGSELFDEITKLDEYYPTRTERKILSENLVEMSSYLGDKIQLIEPGSGSSEKTRILLSGLDSICCYIPIDISGDYLNMVAEDLRNEYPTIDIQPLVTDYTRSFRLPEIHSNSRKIVFFPGSTIGNFKRKTVTRFFEVVSEIAGKEGGMLIGVDLKKDVNVLEAAYNDSRGITAEFNKNMLRHLNREIGSDFNPDLFEHHSVWVDDPGQIEMRLIAKEDHKINVAEEIFEISEGEYIHTENSHKYSLEEFEEIVSPWFKVVKVWTDESDYFSVQYLEPR